MNDFKSKILFEGQLDVSFLDKGQSHVYVLYDEKDKAAYVGQSTHIFQRLSEHERKKQFKIKRCKFYVVNSEDLFQIEKEIIAIENPYLNTQHNIGSSRKDIDTLFRNRKKSDIQLSLKDYLYEKRISITEFSKSIGYQRTGIQGYLNGYIRLGKKAAFLIEQVTDGIVTMERILIDNPSIKKNTGDKNNVLNQYLLKNNISVSIFAKRINIAREYLSYIINGKKRPGARLARDISIETGGIVTVEELRRKKDVIEQYNLPLGET